MGYISVYRYHPQNRKFTFTVRFDVTHRILDIRPIAAKDSTLVLFLCETFIGSVMDDATSSIHDQITGLPLKNMIPKPLKVNMLFSFREYCHNDIFKACFVSKCNAILEANIVEPWNDDSNPNDVFGIATVDGNRFGLIGISEQTYWILLRLQQVMCDFIKTSPLLGGTLSDYRGKSDAPPHLAFNVIDGQFLTQFLYIKDSEKEHIMTAFNSQRSTEKITANKVSDLIEILNSRLR